MPSINLTVKPTTNCNMRCKYCKVSLSCPGQSVLGVDMDLSTLREVMKKAFAYADGSLVTVSFEGGEPLTMGKDFYRSFASMLADVNPKGSAVHIALQTNGLLIDDEWCDIFIKNHYLVCLSLDGDFVTNILRVDADGEQTFEKGYESAKLLQAKKVDFTITTVLTKTVVDNVTRVYSFFRKNKFKHLQFLPCLKPLKSELTADTPEDFFLHGDEVEDIENKDFYINANDYETFLKKAFSLYVRDYIDGRGTSIRLFDNFVRLAHSQKAEQCGMNGQCAVKFTVLADGSVYPCEHYCSQEYLLGNILQSDFATLENSPIAVEFIRESIGMDNKCTDCIYYRLCRNGCKRERVDLDICTAYKGFFPYALPHLKRMK